MRQVCRSVSCPCFMAVQGPVSKEVCMIGIPGFQYPCLLESLDGSLIRFFCGTDWAVKTLFCNMCLTWECQLNQGHPQVVSCQVGAPIYGSYKVMGLFEVYIGLL